jgi:hypothetical protein
MKSKADEVARIVSEIDETREAEHFRSPDRPDARFVKPRRRQDPAIGRAKTRARTAAWRVRLDQRGAATTYEIGMALVVALATAKSKEMTGDDWDLVGRALADLQSRGFDLAEVKDTLRRLRRRLRDPADDRGEPSESSIGANAAG